MASRPWKALAVALAMVCLSVATAAAPLDDAHGASGKAGSLAGELVARDQAVLSLPDARASARWVDARQGERRAHPLALTAPVTAGAAALLLAGLGLLASHGRFGRAARGNPRQGRAPPLPQPA